MLTLPGCSSSVAFSGELLSNMVHQPHVQHPSPTLSRPPPEKASKERKLPHQLNLSYKMLTEA